MSTVSEPVLTTPPKSVHSTASKRQCRYIGGYCIAKLKYQLKSQLKNQKTIDLFRQCEWKLTKLNNFIANDKDIHEHSKYPETLKETDRRQNSRHSLVHITDDAFEFFNELAVTLHTIENSSVKYALGLKYYTLVIAELKNNNKLADNWELLFTPLKTVQEQLICHHLCTLTLHLNLCSLMRQKRHDFMRQNNIRKKAALRSELKQQATISTSDEFMESIKSITGGTASEADHLCLQLKVIRRPQTIQQCTKMQMQQILKHYNCNYRTSLTKQQLIDTIIENVDVLNIANYSTSSSEVTTNLADRERENLYTIKMVAAEHVIDDNNDSNEKCILCNEFDSSDGLWLCCDECHRWHLRLCVGEDDDLWQTICETDCDWVCYKCCQLNSNIRTT